MLQYGIVSQNKKNANIPIDEYTMQSFSDADFFFQHNHHNSNVTMINSGMESIDNGAPIPENNLISIIPE